MIFIAEFHYNDNCSRQIRAKHSEKSLTARSGKTIPPVRHLAQGHISNVDIEKIFHKKSFWLPDIVLFFTEYAWQPFTCEVLWTCFRYVMRVVTLRFFLQVTYILGESMGIGVTYER